VGGEEAGLRIALSTLDFSRVGSASISIGIARASLEEALEYARKRKVFGGHVTDLQAVQWMLADIATELEAARLLRDQAAWLNDQGLHPAKEAAMAKLFAAEMAVRAAVKGMQICGAHGCMREAPLERYLRDAKMYEVAGGTSEIMRLTIARRVLSPA
jgi:alkylation response protein AidB-like acyl-CoA dehydrogenase